MLEIVLGVEPVFTWAFPESIVRTPSMVKL